MDSYSADLVSFSLLGIIVSCCLFDKGLKTVGLCVLPFCCVFYPQIHLFKTFINRCLQFVDLFEKNQLVNFYYRLKVRLLKILT